MVKYLFAITLGIIFACSDGKKESEKKEATPQPWTLEQINSARQSCYRSLSIEDLGAGRNTPTSVKEYYCVCVVEEVTKRWGFEDFIRNQTTYTDQLTKDGVQQNCADKAQG
jgi:hypothetical protein